MRTLAQTLLSFKRVCKRINAVRKAWNGILAGEVNMSYSQCGEDLMLRGFMEDRFNTPDYHGFWVDVGAHDPMRFSNTKMFSDRGWTGINVDAMPEAIAKFNRYRPNDININVGIGECSGTMDYFMFPDYVVNTFSREFADEIQAQGTPILEVRKVPVRTLAEVLDETLPENQHIDFFTIDTEGLDIVILRSNDWTKYRPDFVLIEIHSRKGENRSLPGGEVADFMKDNSYEFIGQCLLTTLFKRCDAF